MKSFQKIFVVLFLSGLLIPVFGFAQSPGIPHKFYGTVTFNNGAAPDGLIIEAKIKMENAVIGTSATNSGKYGYLPDLLFATDSGNTNTGKTVEFYVSGIKANETAVFVNGESTNLNLTVPGTIGTIEETNEDAVIENEIIAVAPTQPVNIKLGTNLSVTVSSVTNTNATIEKIEKMTSGNVAVFSGKNFLNAYEIKISGESLNISVVMNYDDTGIDEDTIAPYWFDGTTWIEITDSVVDKNANTITFNISSGSTIYAVFGLEPEPTPSPSGGGGGGGGGGLIVQSTSSSSSAGDTNNDSIVDVFDFNTLMVNWGSTSANNTADFSGDGKVDIFDFNLLMVNWTL